MKAYFELQSGTPHAYVIETDDPRIWANDPKAARIGNAAGKRALHDEALTKLREIIKPGDTIYTNVRHVSRSGMSRRIQAFIIHQGEPWNISGYVARALDWRCDRDDLSIHVNGCGMDMGFHLVYSLSSVLFPQGFDCIGETKRPDGSTARCPSNDHSNRENNRHHKDGGYALRHKWL